MTALDALRRMPPVQRKEASKIKVGDSMQGNGDWFIVDTIRTTKKSIIFEGVSAWGRYVGQDDRMRAIRKPASIVRMHAPTAKQKAWLKAYLG